MLTHWIQFDLFDIVNSAIYRFEIIIFSQFIRFSMDDRMYSSILYCNEFTVHHFISSSSTWSFLSGFANDLFQWVARLTYTCCLIQCILYIFDIRSIDSYMYIHLYNISYINVQSPLIYALFCTLFVPFQFQLFMDSILFVAEFDFYGIELHSLHNFPVKLQFQCIVLNTAYCKKNPSET